MYVELYAYSTTIICYSLKKAQNALKVSGCIEMKDELEKHKIVAELFMAKCTS